MILNFFKKKKDDDKKEVKPESKTEEQVSDNQIREIKGNWSGDKQMLRGFYVSEKSSFLQSVNQYMFKIYPKANKAEVKKQVEKVFDVKVKDVKILNMPKKRRDMGKHPGFKSGFKKAIVILKEGYSIEQAKT